MPWVRIDEDFPDHWKVAELGSYAPLAGWLFLCGLAYCNRQLTDGRIPKHHVHQLANFRGLAIIHSESKLFGAGEDADAVALAQRLVDVGLWEDDGAYYRVHDFDVYQPTREQVEEERRQKREAGKQGGLAAAHARARARAKAAARADARARARADALAESKPDPDPDPVVPDPKDRVHPERSEGALAVVPREGSGKPSGRSAPALAGRDAFEVDQDFKRLCKFVRCELEIVTPGGLYTVDETSLLEHLKTLAARAGLPYDSPSIARALDWARRKVAS